MHELLAGRYERRSSLGWGSMGEVWLAYDTVLRRNVAIKVLRRGPEAVPHSVERMMREARLAAYLQHPRVVVVHDLLVVDGSPVVIMEYVDGESLAARLTRERRIPVDQAASIGRDVCLALAAAHAANIVHRDVKPANIMLDRSGRAKLADFGIARGNEETGLTGTGQMIGTVAFMAPEIALGEEPSPAADIYSLGSTLYAALEGHAPFQRDDGARQNTASMLLRMIREDAPAPQYSGPLASLLTTMLDREPGRRPDAHQVLTALSTHFERSASTSSSSGGQWSHPEPPEVTRAAGVVDDAITEPPDQTSGDPTGDTSGEPPGEPSDAQPIHTHTAAHSTPDQPNDYAVTIKRDRLPSAPIEASPEASPGEPTKVPNELPTEVAVQQPIRGGAPHPTDEPPPTDHAPAEHPPAPPSPSPGEAFPTTSTAPTQLRKTPPPDLDDVSPIDPTVLAPSRAQAARETPEPSSEDHQTENPQPTREPADSIPAAPRKRRRLLIRFLLPPIAVGLIAIATTTATTQLSSSGPRPTADVNFAAPKATGTGTVWLSGPGDIASLSVTPTDRSVNIDAVLKSDLRTGELWVDLRFSASDNTCPDRSIIFAPEKKAAYLATVECGNGTLSARYISTLTDSLTPSNVFGAQIQWSDLDVPRGTALYARAHTVFSGASDTWLPPNQGYAAPSPTPVTFAAPTPTPTPTPPPPPLPKLAAGSATVKDATGDGKGHADITQLRVVVTGPTVEVWVDLAAPDTTSTIWVRFQTAETKASDPCPQRALVFGAGGWQAHLGTVACSQDTDTATWTNELTSNGTATTRHATFTTKEWALPEGTRLKVRASAWHAASESADRFGSNDYVTVK
jgi:serine/threonine protein kinase